MRWVVCKSVNWAEKTMDCVGSGDDLEYFDVALGFGSVDTKPVIESDCLIAILEGHESVAFLMYANEVELLQFNGGENGLAKVDKLTEKINALENDINNLKTVFTTWVTAPSDGGAALKLAASSWYGTALAVTTKNELEDTKIMH